MTITRAEAFAPATVANLGVGFDILGLAVAGLGDVIAATWHGAAGAVILDIEGDGGGLPREAEKNVATIAANALLKEAGVQRGVGLHITKGLPSASGLGSSAASSVAAVVAVNALLGEPYQKAELLRFALEGEAAVSGYHADNVAPCLLGGITLTNGVVMERIHKLPTPSNLHLALITPDVEVKTAKARNILPQTVLLKQMVHQTGVVAELVDAIHRGDVRRMARVMEADIVIEPARAHLMPLLEEVRFAAHRAGALALVISGAGPTLCAVCDDVERAAQVAAAMQDVYGDAQMPAVARTCDVLDSGAFVQNIA